MNIVQDLNIINELWKQGYIISSSFVHVYACYTLMIVPNKEVYDITPVNDCTDF